MFNRYVYLTVDYLPLTFTEFENLEYWKICYLENALSDYIKKRKEQQEEMEAKQAGQMQSTNHKSLLSKVTSSFKNSMKFDKK